jgi:hypothetical protein
MTKRPAFETTIDTRLLLQRLLKAEPGETVSYGELGKEIGRKIGGGFSHLQSALRMAQAEGAVFSCVRGSGYQRLTDQDILRASEGGLKRVRRAARRAGNTLSIAEPSKLEANERGLLHGRLSAFAMIAHVAKPASVDRLASATKDKGQELAIAQTLKALAAGAL